MREPHPSDEDAHWAELADESCALLWAASSKEDGIQASELFYF